MYAGHVQTSRSNDSLTITHDLEVEHRDLAKVANDLRAFIAEARFLEAGAIAADFAFRLDRHIDAEERVLFPVFDAATGESGGPSAVLRCEHCAIRKMLTALRQAIARARSDEADALLECLLDVLASHNDIEEKVLYPICDRAVRDEAVREVLLHRIAECLAPTTPVSRIGCDHRE